MSNGLAVKLLLGLLLLPFLIIGLVEPAYVLLFNKPLFLNVILFPKRLNVVQKKILRQEFPFYNKLSDKRKVHFEHRVKSFINKYQFVGKEELRITDEMKVLIASTYVMLTFGMRDYLIDLFEVIVIYPGKYYSTLLKEYHKGEFNPRMKAVVFSWEDFMLGHQVINDNLNLGIHEFSHVLHIHSMKSNDASSSIFYDEFNEVVKYYHEKELNSKLLEKGFFREYAYQNQFEFLAVVLEHFFESPKEFKQDFPELYKKVKDMINFDEMNLN